ncbi:ribonuclease E activity regulator RraA [Chitinimonas taiwanensis]|uniref:4-hydroxy-4-methyl-2-oxoglutarate aldolase n=1 Tax=Chitinimonas taiwanensis DSM 18899 TaxID=1121279 RepID=A0A1K2HG49_9NEIS|nr:ribonuclease E activity regulator RraA [Chitinimonas taiwanensis]SFZ75699.1 regulator of ribonuclease activity A [Chitinimonas taiwanensis DSM 18899]
MHFHTTDLSDAHGDAVQVAEPLFRHFGQHARFAGPIATLKVFEDNSLVRSTLETPGEGRVLVVDGGGSLRCALVGGQLGELAVNNHWAGIVVYGCVRDALELNAQAVGIRALNTHPKKSVKKGEGSSGLAVQFAGVRFEPGHWLYADEDGIVVAAQALL